MQNSESGMFPKLNVLYVEDDAMDANLLMIESERMAPEIQFDHVTSLAEAREKLSGALAYQAILSDMNLPDGFGTELLRDLKEKGINLAFVVMTGSADEQMAVSALQAGADDYLVKGFNAYALVPEAIRRAINQVKTNLRKASNPLKVLYLEHQVMDIDLTKKHFQKYTPNLELRVLTNPHDLNKVLFDSSGNLQTDILLMDYRIPGHNTLDLIKELRLEKKLDIPIVLVTGHGDQETAVLAIRLGADQYVVKHPGYLTQLPVILENAWQRHQIRQEQAQLREKEFRYRMLANSSTDLIFLLNMDFEFTFLSQAARTILGYEPEELLGKDVDILLHPEVIRELKDLISEEMVRLHENPAVPYSQPIARDMQLTARNGKQVWVETRISILRNDEGHIALISGISRDITDRMKWEQELLEAKEKAEESDRLKSSFLANISHEIRTPLNAIVGFGELLSDAEDEETRQGYIGLINEGADSLLSIIHDIVDISKIESQNLALNPGMTDLNELVSQAVRQFSYLIEKREKKLELLCRTLDDEETTIRTDGSRVGRVLTSLLDNAIKFTESGRVEVALSKDSDDVYRISVKDTGIGIAPDQFSRIFVPFVQVNDNLTRTYRGTGLGLPIAKSLCHLLGGEIGVSSEPGSGSEFWFTLSPMAAAGEDDNTPRSDGSPS